jgi:hypothetical protein
MSAVPGDAYFRCAPSSTRKAAIWAFLCVEGVLGVIAVAALHGSAPPHFDLAGATLLTPLLLYGLVRAGRISLTANEHEIRIANQFRTYRLSWDRVDRVQLYALATPLGAYRPAILFRVKSGRAIKAQAVSARRWEQEQTMKDLRRVAPSCVVVDMDIDRYRPKPLTGRRQARN